LPLLEGDSGLTAGSGFYLCHSPERVFTGRVFADLRKYPKLVGGVDNISGSKAKNFYENVLQFDERSDLPRKNGVWDLGSAEAAELAKLAETTYRNINIAFANELALHADDLGIDVNEVIDASNSQPFSHIHRPGISVGGHCIPVYPKFYLSVDTGASIPAAAVTLNESMPGRVAQVVADKLKGLGSPKVAILGLSYRGGVKELAFSGTFPLAFRLREMGIDVSVHDSLFSADEIQDAGFNFYSIGEETDGVVVHTDHDEYARLTEFDFPTASFIYDGRGILELKQFPNVEVNVLGRPGSLLQQ
jgi:nucleotide sugar dehydrogenase